MLRIAPLVVLVAAVSLWHSPAFAFIWGVEPNENETYDAFFITEASEGPVFAVDMFLQTVDGAIISVANNNGNPFDEATGNNSPPGNPGAILIGGSDTAGACAESGGICFSDSSCGGEPGSCVFGQSGRIKLGEIFWNGVGTILLRSNTTAVDGTLPCDCLDSDRSSLPTDCTSLNGSLVLIGEDSNGNGIPNACECGDATGDGWQRNADLIRVQNCKVLDPSGQRECRSKLHNGDATGDGIAGNSDLVRIFGMIQDPSLTRDAVCPARPEPWPASGQ